MSRHSDQRAPIRVSAVVLENTAGCVLTVRKRETSAFMLPGGKPEPGETDRDTAIREIHEELGITLDNDALELLGTYQAGAANEPDRIVEATVFLYLDHEIGIQARARAEIDEIAWVDPMADHPETAPLNAQWVFPELIARRASRSGSVPH